jgi:hypothetical protein
MTTETTAEPPVERSPWYALSVTRVLLATLCLQVGLYLSQVFGGWGKGQAVLIAVAATAGLLLSVIACLVFRLKSQFGLRTLLLAVVVVAIPCGWVGRELGRARQQRALVERFRRYNYLDGGPRLVPQWLRHPLGETSLRSWRESNSTRPRPTPGSHNSAGSRLCDLFTCAGRRSQTTGSHNFAGSRICDLLT